MNGDNLVHLFCLPTIYYYYQRPIDVKLTWFQQARSPAEEVTAMFVWGYIEVQLGRDVEDVTVLEALTGEQMKDLFSLQQKVRKRIFTANVNTTSMCLSRPYAYSWWEGEKLS